MLPGRALHNLWQQGAGSINYIITLHEGRQDSPQ